MFFFFFLYLEFNFRNRFYSIKTRLFARLNLKLNFGKMKRGGGGKGNSTAIIFNSNLLIKKEIKKSKKKSKGIDRGNGSKKSNFSKDFKGKTGERGGIGGGGKTKGEKTSNFISQDRLWFHFLENRFSLFFPPSLFVSPPSKLFPLRKWKVTKIRFETSRKSLRS